VNAAQFHQEMFEAKFEALCHKWTGLLNLGNWAIDYWVAEVIDEDGTVEGKCHVKTQLGHRATVTFASRIGFEDDLMREELIVHEHLHVVLDELGQFVYQHLPREHHDYFTRLMEIAVSDLGRVLVRLSSAQE
jgi:hypothetical protein